MTQLSRDRRTLYRAVPKGLGIVESIHRIIGKNVTRDGTTFFVYGVSAIWSKGWRCYRVRIAIGPALLERLAGCPLYDTVDGSTLAWLDKRPRRCPECRGAGKIDLLTTGRPCGACGGSGRTT